MAKSWPNTGKINSSNDLPIVLSSIGNWHKKILKPSIAEKWETTLLYGWNLIFLAYVK